MRAYACFGLFFLSCFLFSSCGSYKKISYLYNLSDSATIYNQGIVISTEKGYSPSIHPKDNLSVQITVRNPKDLGVINLLAPSTGITSKPGVEETISPANIYTVSEKGTLNLPLVGELHVAGLKVEALTDILYKRISQDYINPFIKVDVLGYKVTVLGEVNNPGAYTIKDPESTTIWDALGLAGDMSIYGKRENVIVMRRDFIDTTLKAYRINLNSTQLFASPVYRIRPNDIVYVEPNKSKVAQLDTSRMQLITIITSILSLGILVFYSRR